MNQPFNPNQPPPGYAPPGQQAPYQPQQQQQQQGYAPQGYQPQQQQQQQGYAPQGYQPQQQQQPPASQALLASLGQQLQGAKQGNASGRYVPPGKYVWDVQEVKVIDTQNGPMFIMQTLIIESDNPEVTPGDVYDVVRPFRDKFGHGPNDIKDFICQAIEQKQPGSNPGVNWNQNFLSWATGPDQPMRGLRFFDTAWDKEKKNTPGETFTKHQITIMEPGTSKGLVAGAAAAPAAPVAPQGQPQGFPPQGAPQGQPQGFPPQGAPQGQPQGFPPQGAPQGQPQGAPQGQPQGAPQGWPAGLTYPGQS